MTAPFTGRSTPPYPRARCEHRPRSVLPGHANRGVTAPFTGRSTPPAFRPARVPCRRIFDPKTGDMTHFVNGVGDPGCGGNTGCPGQDHTFTIVVPLGTES